MRMSVPAFVGRSVVEPEVRAEIDERNPAIEDGGRNVLAVPMGQRREDQVDVSQRTVIETFEERSCINRRQMWMNARNGVVSPALPEQLRRAQLRVQGKKAQQLTADIARCSKDGCPNHDATLSTQLHVYASWCIKTA
jgi:hypothetical protein